MMMLDKRLNAYRNDLADVRLKGEVDAPQFREGSLMQMNAPIATLHRAPAPDAPQETQVLFGETMRVFDIAEGWTWVQLQRDGYVGYLQQEFLSSKIHEATHHVTVPSTLLYTKPSIKTQPVQYLPINAQLSATAMQDQFMELATGGFIFADHAKAIATKQTDFVAVAEQFLNTPYLWGGKSAHGIDCSGLVQTSLHACGMACPRDADMQEQELGSPLLINNIDGVKRGDLIFWAGHVGIMQNETTLLHASGHQMLVVSEPLATVNDRTKAQGKAITRIKRLA
jgi:cell wall-associated NlpC family hydrolase